MPARLTLHLADRPVRQHLLDEADVCLVGRDAGCSIPIDDDTLSRRHAKFAFADGVWRVSDLCSKNGTLVNGQAVNHCQLADGQWIEFGDVLARFELISAAAIIEEERRVRECWQTSIQRSRELEPSLDADELLQRLLHAVVETAGAERGFIMLGEVSDTLQLVATHAAASTDFSGSRSVVERCFRERRPVVCSDTARDPQLGAQPSIVSGTLRALACVPLAVGDRGLGVIYVDSREASKQFTELDVEILQALADHAALVLGVAQLRDDIVDLSDMLPTELDRDTPPDAALIDKIQRLLPELEGRNSGRRQDIAVAGADS